jgi:hypothetical protein
MAATTALARLMTAETMAWPTKTFPAASRTLRMEKADREGKENEEGSAAEKPPRR